MKLASAHAVVFSILCAGLATPIVHAADEKPKGSRPATPSAAQQRADKAKGMALATETAQRVSETQLQIADRVHTGQAACEFNQVVDLDRIADRPGHFRLKFKNASYTVVPEETTTGALRLEDKKAGIVWLQIPSKSMLMNSKIGQRMVDNCLHPEQRAAVRAVEGAAAAPERKP
ncbi:MAG TPA: hypothetical protein VEX14_07285 [Burkholderiaceae bacterium]|nr:hypothetical protein [Burkholderiaceae bacterium]